MTLERCAECDNEISSTAPVCPHCGLVYSRPSVLWTVLKVIVILVLIVVLGGVASCVVCSATARLV